MNIERIKYDAEMFKAGCIHAQFKVNKKQFPLPIRMILKDLPMYKQVREDLMRRGLFDKFSEDGKWLG